MMDIIVRHTDHEAERVHREWNAANVNNKKTWHPLDLTELKAFLGWACCSFPVCTILPWNPLNNFGVLRLGDPYLLQQ